MEEEVDHTTAFDSLWLPDFASNNHSNDAWESKPGGYQPKEPAGNTTLSDSFGILSNLVTGDEGRKQTDCEVRETREESGAPFTHCWFEDVHKPFDKGSFGGKLLQKGRTLRFYSNKLPWLPWRHSSGKWSASHPLLQNSPRKPLTLSIIDK
jgi:hypothetical protein